jgi:L-fuconolactonase
VGWADLTKPEQIGMEPLLKGLRPMLQDIPETEWILRPELQPALRNIVSAGLRFDALIQPRHLRTLLPLCERHPELPVVIDHAAKPDIAHRLFEPWATEIALVAKETSALCKLSGLVTEAGADWEIGDLRPYFHHLLDSFGPTRLMWGSDWPVVNLAGGYQKWQSATISLLEDLDISARAAILGGTAARFYGLAP